MTGTTCGQFGQIKKLQKYIKKMNAGGAVDTRALASAGVLDEYDAAWAEAKANNEELRKVPAALKRYTDLLKIGDKLTADYEKSEKAETEYKAQATRWYKQKNTHQPIRSVCEQPVETPHLAVRPTCS